jgi:hypothetical protein
MRTRQPTATASYKTATVKRKMRKTDPIQQTLISTRMKNRTRPEILHQSSALIRSMLLCLSPSINRVCSTTSWLERMRTLFSFAYAYQQTPNCEKKEKINNIQLKKS